MLANIGDGSTTITVNREREDENLPILILSVTSGEVKVHTKTVTLRLGADIRTLAPGVADDGGHVAYLALRPTGKGADITDAVEVQMGEGTTSAYRRLTGSDRISGKEVLFLVRPASVGNEKFEAKQGLSVGSVKFLDGLAKTMPLNILGGTLAAYVINPQAACGRNVEGSTAAMKMIAKATVENVVNEENIAEMELKVVAADAKTFDTTNVGSEVRRRNQGKRPEGSNFGPSLVNVAANAALLGSIPQIQGIDLLSMPYEESEEREFVLDGVMNKVVLKSGEDKRLKVMREGVNVVMYDEPSDVEAFFEHMKSYKSEGDIKGITVCTVRISTPREISVYEGVKLQAAIDDHPDKSIVEVREEVRAEILMEHRQVLDALPEDIRRIEISVEAKGSVFGVLWVIPKRNTLFLQELDEAGKSVEKRFPIKREVNRVTRAVGVISLASVKAALDSSKLSKEFIKHYKAIAVDGKSNTDFFLALLCESSSFTQGLFGDKRELSPFARGEVRRLVGESIHISNYLCDNDKIVDAVTLSARGSTGDILRKDDQMQDASVAIKSVFDRSRHGFTNHFGNRDWESVIALANYVGDVATAAAKHEGLVSEPLGKSPFAALKDVVLTDVLDMRWASRVNIDPSKTVNYRQARDGSLLQGSELVNEQEVWSTDVRPFRSAPKAADSVKIRESYVRADARLVAMLSMDEGEFDEYIDVREGNDAKGSIGLDLSSFFCLNVKFDPSNVARVEELMRNKFLEVEVSAYSNYKLQKVRYDSVRMGKSGLECFILLKKTSADPRRSIHSILRSDGITVTISTAHPSNWWYGSRFRNRFKYFVVPQEMQVRVHVRDEGEPVRMDGVLSLDGENNISFSSDGSDGPVTYNFKGTTTGPTSQTTWRFLGPKGAKVIIEGPNIDTIAGTEYHNMWLASKSRIKKWTNGEKDVFRVVMRDDRFESDLKHVYGYGFSLGVSDTENRPDGTVLVATGYVNLPKGEIQYQKDSEVMSNLVEDLVKVYEGSTLSRKDVDTAVKSLRREIGLVNKAYVASMTKRTEIKELREVMVRSLKDDRTEIIKEADLHVARALEALGQSQSVNNDQYMDPVRVFTTGKKFKNDLKLKDANGYMSLSRRTCSVITPVEPLYGDGSSLDVTVVRDREPVLFVVGDGRLQCIGGTQTMVRHVGPKRSYVDVSYGSHGKQGKDLTDSYLLKYKNHSPMGYPNVHIEDAFFKDWQVGPEADASLKDVVVGQQRSYTNEGVARRRGSYGIVMPSELVVDTSSRSELFLLCRELIYTGGSSGEHLFFNDGTECSWGSIFGEVSRGMESSAAYAMSIDERQSLMVKLLNANENLKKKLKEGIPAAKKVDLASVFDVYAQRGLVNTKDSSSSTVAWWDTKDNKLRVLGIHDSPGDLHFSYKYGVGAKGFNVFGYRYEMNHALSRTFDAICSRSVTSMFSDSETAIMEGIKYQVEDGIVLDVGDSGMCSGSVVATCQIGVLADYQAFLSLVLKPKLFRKDRGVDEKIVLGGFGIATITPKMMRSDVSNVVTKAGLGTFTRDDFYSSKALLEALEKKDSIDLINSWNNVSPIMMTQVVSIKKHVDDSDVFGNKSSIEFNRSTKEGTRFKFKRSVFDGVASLWNICDQELSSCQDIHYGFSRLGVSLLTYAKSNGSGNPNTAVKQLCSQFITRMTIASIVTTVVRDLASMDVSVFGEGLFKFKEWATIGIHGIPLPSRIMTFMLEPELIKEYVDMVFIHHQDDVMDKYKSGDAFTDFPFTSEALHELGTMLSTENHEEKKIDMMQRGKDGYEYAYPRLMMLAVEQIVRLKTTVKGYWHEQSKSVSEPAPKELKENIWVYAAAANEAAKDWSIEVREGKKKYKLASGSTDWSAFPRPSEIMRSPSSFKLTEVYFSLLTREMVETIEMKARPAYIFGVMPASPKHMGAEYGAEKRGMVTFDSPPFTYSDDARQPERIMIPINTYVDNDSGNAMIQQIMEKKDKEGMGGGNVGHLQLDLIRVVEKILATVTLIADVSMVVITIFDVILLVNVERKDSCYKWSVASCDNSRRSAFSKEISGKHGSYFRGRVK